MHRHTLLLSVTLALAMPAAVSAMQSPASGAGARPQAVAQTTTQQAGPADMRVAIILQRKPAKKSGK